MDKHKLFGFTNVDATTDPDYFIRFLDEAGADESFQVYKRQTFALLDIQAGQRILDVGCGTGEDVLRMAERVGPTGLVVGIDGSQFMVATALQRAESFGLPVQLAAGDAHQLEFADESFDACRADRIFMHLESPPQALHEMVRVTRRGGRVLVYEVDFETLTVDVSDRLVTRKIVNVWCDGFRNGWLGRHVPALFQEAGLQDIQVIPATLRLHYPVAMQMVGPGTVERACAAGLLSNEEGTAWLEEIHTAHEGGRFFATLTGFIVAGRKT
jgi:ubiquinone/menaquinone biosynthesis C-methylase UbiE